METYPIYFKLHNLSDKNMSRALPSLRKPKLIAISCNAAFEAKFSVIIQATGGKPICFMVRPVTAELYSWRHLSLLKDLLSSFPE
jgi:hypothetical protein